MISPAGSTFADITTIGETVRRNLEGRQRRTADGDRRAGVAVVVFPWRDAPHVLVLKRSPRGRNPGQWALPGGRADDSESADEAALRELHEEAGIEARADEVAGLLDDVVTTSGFVMTPAVVVLDRDIRPTRDPREVHSIHPIALHKLLSADIPRWRTQPDGEPLLQLPLRHDMVIHAPTGAVLWQFRETALLGRECAVDSLRQPVWTST